ncbi:MAG: ClbS/DfsB family four-helix bundle protein [Peptococcaceae bacterium]
MSHLLWPYNWKIYGQVNVEFWKKHRSSPSEDSKKMFHASHKK